MTRAARLAALFLLALAAGPPVAAAAKEPKLTVPASRLSAALTCHGDIGPGRPSPVIFAPGTGTDGSQVWALGRGAFEALGHPMCTIAFPDRTTADVQVSVQYLVAAIRSTAKRAKGPVAVAGASQGGLLARTALAYWPSLRRRVSDVVSVAGTLHGVKTAKGAAPCAQRGCPPALWQQVAGSEFLKALARRGDETPGPTAWTTVRSANDDTAIPATGPSPTSALKGASNLLIQDVCAGRVVTHIGTVVDSVTLAALADAIAHPGPAKAARLPADVCAHPYGTGLDEGQTTTFLGLAGTLVGQAFSSVPTVTREPKLQRWAKG